MIEFVIEGGDGISSAQIEKDKQNFFKLISGFEDEFALKCEFVTLDYREPPGSPNFYKFTFKHPYTDELSGFIKRFIMFGRDETHF